MTADRRGEGLDGSTFWKAGIFFHFIALDVRHSALWELDQSAAWCSAEQYAMPA
jgi:hypothetical protein